MEKIADQIAELAAKLQSAAVQYGPEAIDLAGRVYQIKAIGALSGVVVVWVVVAILFLICNALRKYEDMQDAATGFLAGAIVSGVVGVVATAVCLANPIYWAAATDPKFALAANILKAL